MRRLADNRKLKKSGGRHFLSLLLCSVFLFSACGETKPLTAYERGMAALQSADWNTALSYFETSTKTEGEEALGYRGEGLVYLERKEYTDAIQAFSDCLDQVNYPRWNRAFVDDVRFYLAHAYELNGQPDQALTQYSQLLDSERSGEAYLLRGKLYAADGKFGQAAQDFQRAVEREPSYEVYLQIYDVYAGLNRQADGAVFLREAQALSSDTPEDAYQLGRISYFLQDYEAAREQLTKAANHMVPGAAALLGKVFMEEGDISGAKTIFQKAVDGETEAAAGHNGLALCYLYTGEYQKALQQIHEGLQTSDKTVAEELLFNEILVYERQHDFATALDKIVAFLESYPGNETARREYVFLQSRMDEVSSIPEDVSRLVWEQIMRDWEEEEPEEETIVEETPAPVEETYEEEAPKVSFDDLEENTEYEEVYEEVIYDETAG